MPFTLREFNVLPADQAQQALLACCAAARWAGAVAAGRPFGTIDDVLRRSDAAVSGLTVPDLREALAGHPRIGRPPPAELQPGRLETGQPASTGQPEKGRPPTGQPGWSRQEQSGVDPADQATMQALADGNQAYERRFGHIYLACATGRSGHRHAEEHLLRRCQRPGGSGDRNVRAHPGPAFRRRHRAGQPGQDRRRGVRLATGHGGRYRA